MNEIEQAYEDSKRAVADLDFEKANAHWRRYIALLEQNPAAKAEQLRRDGEAPNEHP